MKEKDRKNRKENKKLQKTTINIYI